MNFKTPAFWYDIKSPAAKITALVLLPFSLIYLAGFYLRKLSARPYKASIPVICIGNLVAGGSGKTPVALALAELLRTHKPQKIPCFLTRGYGGTIVGSEIVTARHTCKDAGDEPLLLSRALNTIISRNRADGARLAEQKGFDSIIMDDGLQNRQLHKNLSFLVIDGAAGLGNNLPLPAGPLREISYFGVCAADAAIMIGEDRTNVVKKIPENIPVFYARLETHNRHMLEKSAKYIAFCGLGRPEKFLDTLKTEKIDVVEFHPFADHHPYTPQEMKYLSSRAQELGARLITTEKDAVRLPPGFRMGDNIDILSIRLRWENPGELIDFLAKELPGVS